MKKRVLSLLLCLVMCVSLLPASVMAADDPVEITSVDVTGVPTLIIAGESTDIDISDITVTTEPENAVTVDAVYWYNIDTYRSDDTTFTSGKTYGLVVILSPKVGYTFSWDTSTSLRNYTGTATFNNAENAGIAWSYQNKDVSLYMRSQGILAEPLKSIEKVDVTGVPTAIMAGNFTDISESNITVTTEPENAVTVDAVYWYNIDTYRSDDTTFKPGNTYGLGVIVSPKYGYTFDWDHTSLHNYTGTATFNNTEKADVAWSYQNKDISLYMRSQGIKVPSVYNVYVNGDQFADDNLEITCGSGKATYDPKTNTLTLDNARIDQTRLGYGIYAENGLNIVLKGSNYTTNLYAIRVKGDLNVTGEGSLNVTGTGQTDEPTVYADGGKVVFDCSGDITIDSKTTCVSATNDVTLAGSGKITMESSRNGSVAVESVSGDVIISGNGEVNLKGDAHAVSGNLKLNGEAAPITLSAFYSGTAVSGTVAGTNFDKYTVTGAPDTSSVVYAPITYGVWVNGEQFTSLNLTIKCGDGTATYDPEKAELTLENADITKPYTASNKESGIYADAGINITLVGTNTINLGKEFISGCGIYAHKGDMTISGDGDLTVNAFDDGIYAYLGSITISANGDVTVDTGDDGIVAEKGMTISGDGDIAIDAGYYGMCTSFGTLTISGNGDVTVNVEECGIFTQHGDITVSGDGDVTVTAAEDKGIYANNGSVTISGNGEVTVNSGYDDGIFATNAVTVSGSGNITIKAGEYGIAANYGDVTISGSGKVDIYGKEKGVLFGYADGKVLLNGTGSLITLKADKGGKAVYNIETEGSPVSGSNFNDYKCVTGAPDTASVVYRLEHSFTNYVSDGNATCTADGTKTATCANGCGATDTVADTGSAKDHTYGEWTTTKEPTETETGIKERTCSACGDKDTDVIPVLPHTHKGSLQSGTSATCTTAGVKDYYTCFCGKAFADATCNIEIADLDAWKAVGGSGYIAPTGHSFTTYTSNNDATCTADGTKTATCANGCGATNTVADTGSAKGHTYGEWTTTKEPTLAEKGMKERTCTACSDKQAAEIPVLTPVTYSIISGANGEWTKGSTEGLVLTSDADFVKFVCVKVDGAEIASANYTAVSGSTKVTLNVAYLETLSEGSHFFEIASNDGSASTNFTVKAAALPTDPTDPTSPQTGDNSYMFLWIALLFVSSSALVGTAVFGKRRKRAE